MADIYSKDKRSELMSRVKRRNTKPELFLKSFLDGRIFRYQPKGIPGSPDFASKKRKIAIFVDGCFWHGCPRCYKEPNQNREFWRNKIIANKKRDRRDTRMLRKEGWKVIRIWGHELRKKDFKKGRINTLIN